MSTYGLNAHNKRLPNYLTPMHTEWNTEEVFAGSYDLYLSDEYTRDEHLNVEHFYRLHAKYPHNIEMALAYDIKCPRCQGNLKQVVRCMDSHTLGLYQCPNCDK